MVLILKMKKLLLAFAFWNGCFTTTTSIVPKSAEINLPGEPLTPKDFQNAKAFTQPESLENKVPHECELFPDDFKDFQRAKDQPSFNTWENGYVPYLIDFQFGLSERATIAAAVARLRRVSCINFVTKFFHTDYVFIAKRSGPCGSYVGRMGGEQLLKLNDDCMTEGSILHEFLHVIGFEHEQCRMDRDKYVRISFYNVSEEGKHNFFKIPPPRANYAGPYDVLSITHYSAFAFQRKEGLQTIFPNDKVKGPKMGQREQLSEIDKFKIRNFYNCTSTVPHETYDISAINSLSSDIHTNCKEFAKLGACNNPSTRSWMKMNCRSSCDTSNAPLCADYNATCSEWAKNGACSELDNRDYMTIYCSDSCNYCSN